MEDPSLRSPAASIPRSAHAGSSRGALGLLLIGCLVLAASSALMILRVEPIYTWYYSFAWYATIAIADAWGHRRRPDRPLLFAQPRVMVSLVIWSAVIWLFFELWNLRLTNWYYIWVPQSVVARRLGVVLAFGTVLPAIFAIEKLLAAYGVGERLRTRSFRFPSWSLVSMVVVGVLWGCLVLWWPQAFFPLVWGVTVLMLAPLNHKLSGAGLLAELESGRWARIVRLLLAGLACGFMWEMFNIRAGSKWVYTVPGFEEFKLFEMPLLGFVGFPPFALECYVMYRSLVLAGVAVPWEPEPCRRRARAIWAVPVLLGAVAILVLTPPLMDRYTVDSRVPGPTELLDLASSYGEAGVRPPVDALRRRGVRDAQGLAVFLRAPDAATHLGLEPGEVSVLAGRVELALLKGLGVANVRRLLVAGIDDVESLAGVDGDQLAARLAAADPEWRGNPARVRVWVRAARLAVEQ